VNGPVETRCGFCDHSVEQLVVNERETVRGVIAVLSCPHYGAILAAVGLGHERADRAARPPV
jgi:hypothetical protein